MSTRRSLEADDFSPLAQEFDPHVLDGRAGPRQFVGAFVEGLADGETGGAGVHDRDARAAQRNLSPVDDEAVDSRGVVGKGRPKWPKVKQRHGVAAWANQWSPRERQGVLKPFVGPPRAFWVRLGDELRQ